MSASSKKQLRKEERMAQLTERQKKEQAEAKKLKILTAVFITVLALIVVAFLTVTIINHVTAPQNTTALTVGDHDINSVVMSYYYSDVVSSTYQEYYNMYGENAALMLMLSGLDTATPLDQQQYSEEQTWADYFLELAMNSAKNDYVLYDMAKEEGFQLSEEDWTTYDSLMSNKKAYAELGNFPTVSDYLVALYGRGADEDSYREYVERSLTANAFYNAHSDSLEFTADQLTAYENEHINEFSAIDYASCYLSYTDFVTGGTKDEDGNTTYSDAEKDAARAAAKEAAEKLAADSKNLLQLDKNYKALKDQLAGKTTETEPEATEPATEATEPATEATEAATEATEAATEATEAATEATEAATEATEAATEATEAATEPATEPEEEHDHDHDHEEETTTSSSLDNRTRYGYTQIPEALREWLTDSKRQKDEITVIASETTIGEGEDAVTTINGYYVVCFQNRDDNKSVMGNVHHVLIAPQEVEDEDGNLETTDATWNTAKENADMFLKAWKEEGDITAESFATMAAELVEEGSAQEEALYENVNTDTNFVEGFLDWAIDPNRKAGDAEVVKSSHGYHIMFYTGASEQNYREYLIENSLLSKTMQDWYDGIMEGIEVTKGNTSRMELGLVLTNG